MASASPPADRSLGANLPQAFRGDPREIVEDAVLRFVLAHLTAPGASLWVTSRQITDYYGLPPELRRKTGAYLRKYFNSGQQIRGLRPETVVNGYRRRGDAVWYHLQRKMEKTPFLKKKRIYFQNPTRYEGE